MARLGRPVAAGLVLIGCVVAAVPFAPSFPGAELDSSWMFAVNAAVGQRLAFGRDLIFTFGPYASLYTLNYHPATDGMAMVASLVVAVALAAGLVALTHERARWRAVLLALLLSLLWLRDPLFFLVPLVLLAVIARVVANRRGPGVALNASAALLTVALALLPLVKGTFGASAAVALGLGGLLLLIHGRWRRVVALGLLFLAALAGAWLCAHQRLSDLPAFFVAQSLIVGGYTEAMALPGPIWQVAAFLGGAAAVLLLNLWAATRRGSAGLTVLAGAAVLLLLAFKAGFVRQDEHIAIAAGALGLTAILLAVVNRGRLPVLGLLAGLLGWGVLDRAAEGLGPRRAALRIETAYQDAARGAWDRLHGGAGLRKGYAAALARIRTEHPLPPLMGSSDIYSTGQSILLAHGLPWSPRPVLQSYSAYSVALEQDDARHLAGDAAPQTLLVSLEPIDNRLPALEDGLSWPLFLARYQATALLGNIAILRRLPGAPVVAADHPAAPVQHRLGEAVPLGGGPTWAEIDVQPTLLGRLLAAAFRPPPLGIVMRMRNGKVYAFRYVSGMGRAGFVISPLVGSMAELLALQLPALHAFDDAMPASFTIDGDGRYWQGSYTASLTPLPIQPRPEVGAVLFQTPQPGPPPSGGDSMDGKCWLDLVDGQVVDHAKPLVLTGRVRLNGWGFGEAAAGQGAEPEALAVSLRSADGTVVAAPAASQVRSDVGLYFHQPALSRIGFQALVDLHALTGTFGMALEMTAGNRHWSCPLSAPVMVVPAQP